MSRFIAPSVRAGCSVSALALVAALSTPAAAQTAPAPTTNAPTTAETDTGGIGDIIVTAQRREENLQQVPIAITAITGDALRAANVTDINRLEQLTPGLRIGRSGSDARPAMRGVFTDLIGANSDPRIAFYIDDIYQSRTSQALAAFVDLERVEVQKGPQGTLYGRNSFGGNIVVVSAVPRDEFAAGVDLTYGRFNRARAEGYINLPLGTPGIAFRLSGSYDRMDPYIRNTGPGSSLGDEDAGFVRGVLKIAPEGSGLDLQIRASYYRQGGAGVSAFGYKSIGTTIAPGLIRAPGGSITLPNGQVLTFPNGFNGASFASSLSPVQAVPFNSRFRDGVPDVGGADIGLPVNPDPWGINFDAVTQRKTDQKAVSATLNYDFGGVRFRSITGYTDFYSLRQSDNDFYLAPVALDWNITWAKTFSQEVQLLSNDRASPFQWIVGGYYFNDEVQERFFSQQFRSLPTTGPIVIFPWANTLLPTTPLTNIRSDTFAPVLSKTKSYAGFAQVSYTIADRLTLTAGYRYTSDQKRYAAGVTAGAAGGGFLAFQPYQGVNYTCPTQVVPTNNTAGNNPAAAGSTATNAATALSIQCGNRNFNFSTWRGAIDYRITDRNLVYASVSRGVHSGGFNNVLNTVTGLVLPFEAETVTAYEVGTKNRFANDTVQVNASFFYNQFKNLQVQQSVPSPSGLTVLSLVGNAGRSRAYGAEIETIFKPTERLTFQVAFNYLNAKDTDFVTGTFSNGLCGVVTAGTCATPPRFANPAAPTATEIAAYNAVLFANRFGIGPQGAPFPNPVTDPSRFTQVFLPNGQAAVQGGNLPVYNYVIAGTLAGGQRVTSPTVFSPEFTIQLGLSYDIDFAGGKLTPSVQSYFSSSYINTAFTPYFGTQPAFTRTDARLSFVSGDDRLRLQLFVENIENVAVLNRVAFGGNRSLNAVYGLPRMYGVKAGVKF